MNAPRRALFSAAVWAALLAPGAAQLELKREPLPRAVRIGPPLDGEVILLPVFRERANRVIVETKPGEAAKAEADPAGPQVIEFANGDRLRGALEALDFARGEILWRRSDAAQLLAIPLAEVARLRHDPAPAAQPRGGETVKFTGGDWVTGEVTSLDGGRVQVRLSEGAVVTVDRARVEWIYFSKSAAAECYDGPTSLTGWASEGGWGYRDGALRATGPSPISRPFAALPDRVEYRFTVDPGAISGFTVSLHGRSAGRGLSEGMLRLHLQSTSLTLSGAVGGHFKNQQVDLTAPLDWLGGRGKVPLQVRIFEDFPAGRLLVFLQGRQAAEWSVDKGTAGKNGGGFQFQPTSWNGELEQTLSRIKVLPWDGRLPEEDEELMADRATLRDGEVKAGRALSLDAKNLRLQMKGGRAAVPRERLQWLRLRRPEDPPDEAAPIARVRLGARGEFDVLGLDWKDGKFQVRTNFGGEFTLPPLSVTDLEFALAARTRTAAEDTLVFRNGDRLNGALQSATGEKLQWRLLPGGRIAEFARGQVAGVQLAARGAEPAAAGASVVRLRNGDWASGRLQQMDRERVSFQAGSAEPWSIPRARVKALYFNTANGALSDATADHETWERGVNLNTNTAVKKPAPPSPWRYFAGAFTLSPSMNSEMASRGQGGVQLGRVLEALPARVELRFTISRERTPAYFGAQLFAEPNNTAGYVLHFSSGGLSLYDPNARARGRGGPPQQFSFGKEIAPNARTREVQAFADRPSGRVTILVDGVIVARYQPRGADGPRNLGRGVMLMPQGGGPTTISNVWVGPWSGRLPGADGAAPESVLLANGDDAQGTIEGASAAAVQMTSEVGPLELPLERVTMLDFGGAPITAEEGARLLLRGGGRLTVSAWRIDGDVVACRSEILGELKVPLTAVQEIVFASSAAPGAQATPK